MSFSVDYNRPSIFKYQVLRHNYVDGLWFKTIRISFVLCHNLSFLNSILKDTTNFAFLMALNLDIDGHLIMCFLMIIFMFRDDWLQNTFIN